MALDEHADVEGNLETFAEFLNAVGFAFAAAIGEKNEGDAVVLEVAESLVGAWKRFRAA